MLQYWVVFFFQVFWPRGIWSLRSQIRTEPALPALGGDIVTAGSPWNSPVLCILKDFYTSISIAINKVKCATGQSDWVLRERKRSFTSQELSSVMYLFPIPNQHRYQHRCNQQRELFHSNHPSLLLELILVLCLQPKYAPSTLTSSERPC